jgi:flagellar transcriptional activator FlhD
MLPIPAKKLPQQNAIAGSRRGALIKSLPREIMTTNDIIAEIRDANLGYLMLAQQMIRADKATAIFRLGISSEIADLIEGMNNSQILKLASANMMLARFRFDDGAILGMLTNYNKERSLAHSHAAILMAGQAVEQIA